MGIQRFRFTVKLKYNCKYYKIYINIMNIPDEILKEIYNYNLNAAIPNKMINEYVIKKKEVYAKKIQEWYKNNKIESTMPILFVNDLTENPRQFQKWYIIRLFMKFYPREDLRDYPLYLLRNRYGKKFEEYLSKEKVNEWKNIKSNWQVLQFMHKFNLQQIVKTGW